MARRKPDNQWIDDAVAEVIEFVVTCEQVYLPHDVRRAVRRGTMRAGRHYGLRRDEARWVAWAACHRLGA